METIKQVLMRRDSMSEDEAEEVIAEAKETLDDYINENDIMSAMDICEEFFGLEPDYLDEIMPV